MTKQSLRELRTFPAPVPACYDLPCLRNSAGQEFWPGQLVRAYNILGQWRFALVLRLYYETPNNPNSAKMVEIRTVDARYEYRAEYGHTNFLHLGNIVPATPQDTHDYFLAMLNQEELIETRG
jgi:hypothetical protein